MAKFDTAQYADINQIPAFLLGYASQATQTGQFSWLLVLGTF